MATAMGGTASTLVKGQPVDTSGYGPAATGAVYQVFWDDPPYDYYTGKPLGIVGDMYGKSPWDKISLNGTFLPGAWDATGTPSVQLDVQKPNGFDGAALVSRGYVPAGITLTGKIWTPEQWQEWQRILPTFWSPPNKYAVNDQKRQSGQIQGKGKAVAVIHPGLNAMNIHTLVIKQITPPEQSGDKGVRQIKIIAVEYVPEPQKKKPAIKKVAGNGVDRSVQASKILGTNATNNPKPPSKSQAHQT